MPEQFDAHNTMAAFNHDSTLVVALELSGKSWQVGAVVPGVARRRLEPRDMAGLLKAIEQWKAEAAGAGRVVRRVALTYEAGRDGFWIARYLLAQGIEVQVVHPASIPVERPDRRVKTDRIDLDMLLRTFWRGCGASRGCARWCACPARPRRKCAGRDGSASVWYASACSSKTASRTCCVCRGWPGSGRA